MKRAVSFSVIAIILVLILILGTMLLINIFTGDRWVKDYRGIWMKKGNPAETPKEVLTQQEAIKIALQLYEKEKSSGNPLGSQCLGTAYGYAIDLVHDPRTEEDELTENQCKDYYEGRVYKFIEINTEGDIVRVYDI